MQSHSKVIEFPTCASHEDDGPRFVAWRYDRGGFSIHVEGFDDQTDGEMLLSLSPEVGVEIGEPTVIALSGEPSMAAAKRKIEGEGLFLCQCDQAFRRFAQAAKVADEVVMPASGGDHDGSRRQMRQFQRLLRGKPGFSGRSLQMTEAGQCQAMLHSDMV